MSGPTIDGREYAGVQLVTHEDRNAGFCALMTYALNGIRKALELNRLPVVLFEAESSPQFFDADRGPNVWEYYFEPVMKLSYAELMSSCESKEWEVHRFSFREILSHHLHDPDRIATFWAYDRPRDPKAWMAEKRALGRSFVARYVRPRESILAKAESFYREHLAGRYTVGAHVRGTDFAYADPIEPGRYIDGVRAHVTALGLDSFQVFLATDQEQFVALFEREFGDRLVVSDCVRSRTAVAPFNLAADRSRSQLGEEVLIDILLLSRCQYLLKGGSAVGEYALWFAPELECTDFALTGRFRKRQVDLLLPAFRKLNVAGQRGPALWLSRAWNRMEWPRHLVLALSRAKSWVGSIFERRRST